MIRYKCDKCGRDLSKNEPRFEANIEAGPVYDENTDFFEDLEFGEESLTDMIERLDREAWRDSTAGSFHFDLCEPCYQEFIASPLFKGMRARSGFKR